MTLGQLTSEISRCDVCRDHLPLGPRPVVQVSDSARILIIGQAPGTRVHESGIPWDDKSGDRLRQWMGVTSLEFYDQRHVAIMPMGFCYPGRNDKNGGDNPPRPECAPLWHDRILALIDKNIQITLLVGSYAQQRYLKGNKPKSMTDTVHNWRQYGPALMPLPHPSWRTTGWLVKNPWFEKEVLPELQVRINTVTGDKKDGNCH